MQIKFLLTFTLYFGVKDDIQDYMYSHFEQTWYKASLAKGIQVYIPIKGNDLF